MTFDASSRPNCATVAEKVAKLSEFIAGDLEARTRHGLQPVGSYLLVARSPVSPVAQALRASASGLAAANVSVRAIFCEIETAGAEAALAFSGECRVLRDTRLLAAHEQLVLAPDRAWIGDSMRRDPSRRDTYERFAANSAEVATLANRSFERLWQAAVPMRSLPQVPAVLASRLPGVAVAPFARSESPRRQ
ncbi:MAG TPA: hypothetical protein VH852_03545 [Hyphomicrobium sp.]|jgi:hypothetical protein